MGCDIHTIIQIKKQNKWETLLKEEIAEFDDRNYTTFAVLANVRNSFNLKHFEVKGLPTDMESHLIKFSEEEDDVLDFDCEDYHSHNYITLKEFKEFDYTDYETEKIKISKKFYDKFIELGGVMPKGIKVNTDIKASDFLEVMRLAVDPYIIVSYKYHSEKKGPILLGVDKLEELAKKYEITNTEDIRIVFCFDN